MKLYLFNINSFHKLPSGENELVFNFTEQKERSRVHKPGQQAIVDITDSVPLVFSPFMPIRNVIAFLRQAADHLERQVAELTPSDPTNDG